MALSLRHDGGASVDVGSARVSVRDEMTSEVESANPSR